MTGRTTPSSLGRLLAQPLKWLGEGGRRGEMARGASSAFLIRVGGTGLAFFVQILLARILGVPAFGEYAYVLSMMLLLSLFTRMGLDSASLRFVASYRGANDWGRLRGFVAQSHRLTILASLLVSALTATIIFRLRTDLSPTLAMTAWIGCTALPLFSLLHLQSATLRGLGRVVSSLLPPDLVRPLALGVVVVSWHWATEGVLGAPKAMLANLTAIALALAITAVALRRCLSREVSSVERILENSAWIGVAGPLLMIGGLQVLLAQTDVLMLGSLVGTDEAGVYSAASRLAQLLPFGLISVNAVVAPAIAELWSQKQLAKLKRLLVVAARATAAVTVGLALLLALLGRSALGFFGPAFVAAHPALMILIVGQLAVALSGSVGFVMTMTGLERKATMIVLLVALLNLLLNATLIPAWGLNGAATATACTIAVWNGAMLLTVARHRNLNASVFSR